MKRHLEKYIAPLRRQFEMLADPVKAAFEHKYVREKFEFYGLGAKVLREATKEFFSKNGYTKAEKLGELSLFLWNLNEREYQQVVVDLLHKFANKLKKEDISWIEQLIVSKSWWDTVDGLAAWICGTYFINYPEQIIPVTGVWMDSNNIWLQRSALLFQLKYKRKTDTDLLGNYIERLINHKDFFIRKAIGWVLREYSKTNPIWVKTFVKEHSLSGLSYREAIKYI